MGLSLFRYPKDWNAGPILDSTGSQQHDIRMSNFVSIYEK